MTATQEQFSSVKEDIRTISAMVVKIEDTVHDHTYRLGIMRVQLSGLDQRLDNIERRIDERLDKVDARFGKVDGRLDKVDGRLDRLETAVSGLQGSVDEILTLVRKSQ